MGPFIHSYRCMPKYPRLIISSLFCPSSDAYTRPQFLARRLSLEKLKSLFSRLAEQTGESNNKYTVNCIFV